MKKHKIAREPLPRPPCPICSRSDAPRIEKALRGGLGINKIARELALPKPALSYHKDFCLRGAYARGPEMRSQIPVGRTGPAVADNLAAPNVNLDGKNTAIATVDLNAFTEIGDGAYLVSRDVFVGINRSGLAGLQVSLSPIVPPSAIAEPRPPPGLVTARAKIWKADP